MKRQYLKPYAEIVNVRLNGSVLGDPSLHDDSYIAGEMHGKENNLEFDFDEDFGDIWGDGDNSSDPYDLWGEN